MVLFRGCRYCGGLAQVAYLKRHDASHLTLHEREGVRGEFR
jgi:hypothetical protein